MFLCVPRVLPLDLGKLDSRCSPPNRNGPAFERQPRSPVRAAAPSFMARNEIGRSLGLTVSKLPIARIASSPDCPPAELAHPALHDSNPSCVFLRTLACAPAARLCLVEPHCAQPCLQPAPICDRPIRRASASFGRQHSRPESCAERSILLRRDKTCQRYGYWRRHRRPWLYPHKLSRR